MRRDQAFSMMMILERQGVTCGAFYVPPEDAGQGEWAVQIMPQQVHSIDLIELSFTCHFNGYKLHHHPDKGFLIDPPQELLPQAEEVDENGDPIVHTAKPMAPQHLPECKPHQGQGTPGCEVCEAMLVEHQRVAVGATAKTCLTLFGKYCDEIPCEDCGNGRPPGAQTASVRWGPIVGGSWT